MVQTTTSQTVRARAAAVRQPTAWTYRLIFRPDISLYLFFFAVERGLRQCHPQHMDLAFVGIDHAKVEIIDSGDFIAAGKMAERVHQDPANGVKLCIGQIGTKSRIKVFNRR